MKYCPKCKQTKPLFEFYKDRSTKDGLQCWCKTCRKACVKAYQKSEKGKAFMHKSVSKYQQTPKGKATQKKYQQTSKGKASRKKYRRTPNGKAVQRKATTKFNARNPNYVKATDAVKIAIRAGKLPHVNTRLCYYCSNPAQEYHHWHGYELDCWLDVVPVCIDCHKKEHRKISDEDAA